MESFWEPSSPLYSFLVALVTKTAPKEVPVFEGRFLYIFVHFVLPLFCEPVLATRATKKEYSSELGPQNDSKMEPKMEPKGTSTKKLKLSYRARVNPPDPLPGGTKVAPFSQLF